MATRERPITSVLTEIISELAFLVQTEIRLAKTEIGEKISGAASGAGLIGGAAILLLAGLFVLLLGAVRWLAIAGVPEQWGFLVVGFAVFLIGGALAWKGANNLKGKALVPKRTIAQVREDFSVVKEQVK
jgi:hypothetical protein